MKGILLATSLVILSLALLGIAFVFYQADVEQGKSRSVLMVYNRMHDEVAYAENSYRTVLSQAIGAETGDSYALFKESLPNIGGEKMKEDLTKLSSFLSKTSDFSLMMTPVEDNFPLKIVPGGAIYEHPSGLGGDSVRVYNASNVSGYDITIIASGSGSINVAKSISPGAFPLTLHAETANSTYSETLLLDGTLISTITINAAGSTTTVVFGGTTEKNNLLITTNGVELSTRINIPGPNHYEILSGQKIHINSETHSIQKSSGIRVG